MIHRIFLIKSRIVIFLQVNEDHEGFVNHHRNFVKQQ